MAKNLRFHQHDTPEKVTQEFQNLANILQEAIPQRTTAPTSGDPGIVYIQYTASDDTTITLWWRHPVSGTWRSVDLT